MPIPLNKIKIFLMGEEYHTKEFCEQLENYEKSVFEPKFFNYLPSDEVLKQFDLFHLISSPLPVIKKLKYFKKPILYHWIGTDVYRFINDSSLKRLLKKLIVNSSVVYNLVVSENLKLELKQFNVCSTIFPLTKLRFIEEIPALPAKFSVLTYVPKNRWEYYRGNLIIDLAGKMPDVDFHILAAGKKNNERPNIFYYDFVEDPTQFYIKCSILLRLTIHDGLPKMVLEALSYGRQVLWSEAFPNCNNIKNFDECINVLNKLKTDCPPNIEGKKFVEDSFNDSKIIGNYLDLCQKIIV